MALEDLLLEWLPQQRWYGGKHEDLYGVEILSMNLLSEGDATLHHVVVATWITPDVRGPQYQLLVGIRHAVPDRLAHAVIGALEQGVAYDAVHDHELTDKLLGWMADNADIGDLHFRHHHEATLERDLHALVMGAEQSNTSLLYGEEYVFKLIRILVPGVNPDLEITRVLTDIGSSHVPHVRGWVEMEFDGEPTTLATLHQYLTSGTDGFSLATTSVRDLLAEGDLHADEVGGDFAAEAERLGVATAEVHQAMAETLQTEPAREGWFAGVAEGMRHRFEEISTLVPELAVHAAEVAQVYDQLAAVNDPVRLQRIHGDFHLGQVLRVETGRTGWVLFDFEGEPGTPVSERTALASPLRDVAGMLRSFDYAAHHLLADVPTQTQLTYRANEWAQRNRDAFCAGYGKAAGRDPRDDMALLRAFELDKAVYEVGYEIRHRPSWVSIPLGGVERLLS
jgi:maltokinase